MMELHPDTLDALPADVARPDYDREGVGIVHLGIGAFHRAHQAVYTDTALARHGGNWGILGVSLRSAAVHGRLTPQDCLYTLVERDADGDRLRVIGAVHQVLAAADDPKAVIARMVDPEIKIVSLTITEKGYLLDPASGDLLATHPDIAHDLENPSRPRTAYGFIVEALARRHHSGQPPFTLLSCDNLPHNGVSLARGVIAFAQRRDPVLAGWIKDTVAFPGTMVDRITPATTDQDIETVSSHLGLHDAAPVITEPFSQWVIEDRFPTGHPVWQDAGAELVDNVKPYEDMKLRLLNGSHSALAYLGYLGGFVHIHETMSNPAYAAFIRAMMDEEVTPTLDIPANTDIELYKSQLIERFSNPALHHQTWQIAMDGSQKLPQRLLDTIRDRLAAGQDFSRLGLAVAAWIRYVTGVDEQGNPIDVSDPLVETLRDTAWRAGNSPAQIAKDFLSVTEVFGNDLSSTPVFVDCITEGLQALYDMGAQQTVEKRA